MKCEICSAKTRVNWAGAYTTLCEKCFDSPEGKRLMSHRRSEGMHAAEDHEPRRTGYDVFQGTDESRPTPRLTAVKNGFSWPAFLVGPLWAWHKGMVALGFGLLIGNVFFFALGHMCGLYTPPPVGIAFSCCLTAVWCAAVGHSANNWYRQIILRRGGLLVASGLQVRRPAAAVHSYLDSVRQ